jgi:hypothetical protein
MLPILVPAALVLAQVPVVERADDGRLVARSASFEARFDAAGLAFGEPGAAPALSLGAREVRRGGARVALADGAPHTSGARVSIERGLGIVEHFDARADGVEHSLVIDGPIGASGDLVVRVAVGGAGAELGERLADGSHRFGDVSYGRLFGIDADGDRVDGDVRLVDGGLELVLPAAFVDTADWPIVLDPLVGTGTSITTPTGVGLSGLGSTDHESDCVYDASTGWHFLVWRRNTIEEVPGPFGTTQTVSRNRVLYRRLSNIGGPVGTELQISSNESYAPRVASVNRYDTFAVTWLEDVGDETRLMCRVYSASTGVATGAAIVIATEAKGDIAFHDVAGEASPSLLVSGRAFVVWVDGSGALKLARVSASSASAPSIVSTTTIAADPGLFESWQQVSVARCTNAEGRLVVALVRRGALSGFDFVQAMTIDRNATVITTPTTVSGPDTDASNPSVDGGGQAPSRWVVAWDNGTSTPFGGTYDLRAAALQVTATPTNALTASAAVTLDDSYQEFQPSVGWRPGMAIVAARNGLDVDVRMVCDTTATIGELPSTVYAGDTGGIADELGALPVVVLRTSGGSTSEHEGLVLWQVTQSGFTLTTQEIWRRRYDAFDPNATASIVAFGCGNVGAIGVSTPPAIGNPDFRLELTGARPTAAIAILNIAAPQPLATCGSCSFSALETLFVLPIVGGEASKTLPIPCNPSLAGAQADVQWIVYEPGIAPCAPVPDFGATGMLRLTLN